MAAPELVKVAAPEAGALRNRRLDERVVQESGPGRRSGLTLFNEVRDRLGILQTVRVMGGAFLNHDGDPAARLVIDVLDNLRVFLQAKIEAAADIAQRLFENSHFS